MRNTILALLHVVICIFQIGCESFFDPKSSEPTPLKIESVSPDNYDTDVPVNAAIRIKMNKHLDANYATASALNLHSGRYTKWLMTYYDPLAMELVAWTSKPLFENTVWELIIDKDLRAMDGSNLELLPISITTFRTGSESSAPTVFTDRTYDEVKPIFEKHCVRCHGAKGYLSLDLRSAQSIIETATNVHSQQRPSMALLMPYRPGSSYLLYKLIEDENISGLRMPRELESGATAIPLTGIEKRILVDWIASGAFF